MHMVFYKTLRVHSEQASVTKEAVLEYILLKSGLLLRLASGLLILSGSTQSAAQRCCKMPSSSIVYVRVVFDTPPDIFYHEDWQSCTIRYRVKNGEIIVPCRLPRFRGHVSIWPTIIYVSHSLLRATSKANRNSHN